MPQFRKAYIALAAAVAIALATISLLSATLSPAVAQTVAFAQLPAQEQAVLKGGEATVVGTDGQFTGRVLIDAPVDNAWQVVTDYNNFDQFLPNTEASRLLESGGDRRVFEQINVVQVFLITRRSRIVVEATLSYPDQINFSLVEGDLEALEGTWRFETVPSQTHGAADRVLITHQVTVSPKGGNAIRGLFFNTYRNVLEETLVAIKQESEGRSSATASQRDRS